MIKLSRKVNSLCEERKMTMGAAGGILIILMILSFIFAWLTWNWGNRVLGGILTAMGAACLIAVAVIIWVLSRG